MDVELYKKNMADFISGGYITSAIFLGKNLGLFDALSKFEKTVTSQELADECDLKERYVREWLGCMVAIEIVFLDNDGKYFVPEECKPGLSIADHSWFYPLVGVLLEKSMECFKKDGPSGYDYCDMPPGVVDKLDGRIYDACETIEQMLVPITAIKGLETISKILDVGCGAGVISRALTKRFPEAEIYGIDYNDMAIQKAKEKARDEGIKNITYTAAKAECLPTEWSDMFDWVVMSDFLHDLPCPVECMSEVMRVSKNDVIVTIIDPNVHSEHKDNVGDVSVAGVSYCLSTMVCLPCSLSTNVGAGLGSGWGKENKEKFLKENGWDVIDKRVFDNSLFEYAFTCVKSSCSEKQ